MQICSLRTNGIATNILRKDPFRKMPHPSLEGFSPTIKAHYLNDYELDEDTMNDAKEYFEAGE